MKQGKLFVVSACSGAGKSSLVEALLKRLSLDFPIERVITYTTKKPRPGELDGRDYHFVSEETFKDMASQGMFLEWSNDYGHYYGSPASVKKGMSLGQSYIAVVDRAGARQIIQKIPNAILIWIYVKNFEILEQRLRDRGSENESQIKKRLEIAQREVHDEERDGFYRHHILNDSFQSALCDLEKIIGSVLEQ